MSNLKRPERANRYKPFPLIEGPSYAEHINALGMVASLLGLLMRVSSSCMSDSSSLICFFP